MDAKHISLEGRTVLLSASVPNLWRSPLYFRNSVGSEIKRAVKSFVQIMLRSRALVAFGGHPSIGTSVLEAAEDEALNHRVPRRKFAIYQSELFIRNIVSNATHTLFDRDWASLTWTPRIDPDKFSQPNDHLSPGVGEKSLRRMREMMLSDSNPTAAVFIGGMEGVEEEMELFRTLYPGRPTYLISEPGGATAYMARRLPNSIPDIEPTAEPDYEGMMEAVAEDISSRTF